MHALLVHILPSISEFPLDLLPSNALKVITTLRSIKENIPKMIVIFLKLIYN